jgi:kynureninase
MSFLDTFVPPEFSPATGCVGAFHVPNGADGTPWAYFAGNSLGLQPRGVSDIMSRELADWANLAVEGHFEGLTPWASYHDFASRLAAPIAGASEDEVVMMNGLTPNLHLLMAGFYRPTGSRRAILMEAGAFPSDRYVVESQLRWHGGDETDLILIEPDAATGLLEEDAIESTIAANAHRLALVMLGGVQFRTGQVLDIERVTQAAHAAGAVCGWDLAHAAGNVPLRLHDWNVDFAAWCSYKYLNSGPGSIAGAFVHQRHHDWTGPRLEGWWGVENQARFKMLDNFVPAAGAHAWQLSNVPVFSTAPWLVSGRVFEHVGMERLRERSLRLTSRLLEDLQTLGHRVKILTPLDAARRGAQVSVQIDGDARTVSSRLRSEFGVICDARPPSILRFAPTPLYTLESDIDRAVVALAATLSAANEAGPSLLLRKRT